MNRYQADATFREGTVFKIMDAPVRLDGGIVFQEDLTSFDVRVYDLDAVRPNKTSVPVFEELGLDPAGINAAGGQYFYPNPSPATVYRLDNDWKQDDIGYVFEYDLNSQLWDRCEGGHAYAVEVRYATLNDGLVFLDLTMSCEGVRSV